jgi:uncharacterized protein
MSAAAPPGFHMMAKPSGATCNIDCKYCFFLSKEALYPNERSRMSEATLEAYIRQLLESHRAPNVTVAWQGGEPTLLGLDFYRRAVELIEQYRRPGQVIEQTFQTNGLLLDDAWCAFFKANNVLVGLSIDGPRQIHDTNRVTRAGTGSFDLVMKGWEALRRHKVDFNILCTVNAANEDHGRLVYRFLRDKLKAKFIQFIPIVERATAETLPLAERGWSERPRESRVFYSQTGDLVTSRSVSPDGYGRFLNAVFGEWLDHDVGKVFVQLFDVTLQAQFGEHLLCVHAPTCGQSLALEHNGDVYSCDHFVEPGFLLGNIHQTAMLDLVASPQQVAFGEAKRETLTRQCHNCAVRTLCHGGCPKDRFARAHSGEANHNYLCEGLYAFFTHSRPAMQQMVALLQSGRAPAEVMASRKQRKSR